MYQFIHQRAVYNVQWCKYTLLTFDDIKLFFLYGSFFDFGRNLFGSFSEDDPT